MAELIVGIDLGTTNSEIAVVQNDQQPGQALADGVADVIARTGVHPSSLCFEITESVLMDDAETVIDVIGRVRALGVQFAIDDFGTGYS